MLVFLVLGLCVAIYFSEQAPKDQHVRFVLGNAAPNVTALQCDYETPEGVVRAANFTFDRGMAPRIVAHDPKLTNGQYTLEIRVFSKDSQNTIEKRVTLDEGTVSIDLASSLPLPAASADSSATPAPLPKHP